MRLVQREFGDVDEAFDAFFDFDERAVRHEVRDLAFDLRTDRETAFGLFPRILLGLLEAEGDALLLLVDVEDEHVEFLADFDHLARVAEAAPGHVGDVEETVHAVEVDERTEVGEVLDHALDGGADLDRLHEGRWRFSLRSCSMSSRRLRTTFFRSSLILTILKS